MDYFDKKIKGLYSQPEQDLPNDLSWEFMEDGVYSRMEKKKPKRRVIWFWISGALVATAVIIAMYMMSSSNDKRQTYAATKNTATQSQSNKSQSTKSKTNVVTSAPIDLLNQSSTKKQIANTIQHKTEDHTSITDLTKNKRNIAIAKNEEKTPNQRSKESTLVINSKSTYDKPLTLTQNDSNKDQVSLVESLVVPKLNAENKRIQFNLSQLSTTELNPFNTSRDALLLNNKMISFDKEISEINNKRNTKYAFSLLGGTTLHSGYNISSSEYATSLPGYSVRLGLSAEKGNNWGYELGIGYSLLVEKFDFNRTDTLFTQHNDVILSQLTNTLTGNTTNLIGDGYRSKERRRKELIYNTTNLFSIDAAIYRKLNLSSKWSIETSIGIRYDRILDIEGKTLDASGEVLAYDNNSTGLNRNLIAPKIGISIDYALSTQFALSLRANSALSFNSLYRDSKKLNTTHIYAGIKIRL